MPCRRRSRPSSNSPPRRRCAGRDGAFLMTIGDLPTAAEYGANILMVVLNNDKFGQTFMQQANIYATPTARLSSAPTCRHRHGVRRARIRSASPRTSKRRATRARGDRKATCSRRGDGRRSSVSEDIGEPLTCDLAKGEARVRLQHRAPHSHIGWLTPDDASRHAAQFSPQSGQGRNVLAIAPRRYGSPADIEDGDGVLYKIDLASARIVSSTTALPLP